MAGALGAQANAAQYIPIGLILLFALEYNGAAGWLIHGLGWALVAGRVIHARGPLVKKFSHRVLGMQITLFTLTGLALVNVIYLPYWNKLASWPPL